MKILLIGEAASAEVQQMIVTALEDGPEVDRVIHMRTVHISPAAILVAACTAAPPQPAPSQVLSSYERDTGNSVRRDCGYSSLYLENMPDFRRALAAKAISRSLTFTLGGKGRTLTVRIAGGLLKLAKRLTARTSSHGNAATVTFAITVKDASGRTTVVRVSAKA